MIPRYTSYYMMLYSVFTPTLNMLYLTLDLWHVISDTDTWHAILDTWYLTSALDMLNLTPDLRHLISDTGTWYVILDTRYMTHANTHLTRFHMAQSHWPDIMTPDRILLPLIPILYGIFMTITFTRTWHDYYIVTRYLVLLNFCAPELMCSWTHVYLNPWNRETPDIMLLILYFCWPS